MNRLAVDLYAGTGGATAAFRGAAGWDVLTVEIERHHRPAVVADVRALPLRPGREVGLLWMSPPCTEFSTADARVDHRTKQPSLELMFAALEAVRLLRPRFWVLENVRGAIPFLGVPVQKIGPWCLWGYFPLLDVSLPMHDHRKCEQPDSAEARAHVPVELSAALFHAVEQHWYTPSLLDLRPFRRHRHLRRHAPTPNPDLFQ